MKNCFKDWSQFSFLQKEKIKLYFVPIILKVDVLRFTYYIKGWCPRVQVVLVASEYW